MQYRFFTVPVWDSGEAGAELNRFLNGHRILAVERQFVQDAGNSVWAICVTFETGETALPMRGSPVPRRGKIDFREILSEPEFAVFARMRALRKERADAEGIPAYAVFTNEHMAEMVQKRIVTAAALQAISGIGEARVAKYGGPFLAMIKDAALPEPEPEDRES
jgi:superfamily II DNA helicase RecQ